MLAIAEKNHGDVRRAKLGLHHVRRWSKIVMNKGKMVIEQKKLTALRGMEKIGEEGQSDWKNVKRLKLLKAIVKESSKTYHILNAK